MTDDKVCFWNADFHAVNRRSCRPFYEGLVIKDVIGNHGAFCDREVTKDGLDPTPLPPSFKNPILNLGVI